MLNLPASLYHFAGIIFDMDGTLLNSEPCHGLAWQETTDHFGLRMYTPEERENLGGMSALNIAKLIIKISGSNADPKTVCDYKNTLYRTKYMHQAELFDGILDLLKAVHAQGIKTAIATGSQAPEASFLIDKFKLNLYLDAIVTSDQVPHGKPAPDTYLIAAQRLNCKPESCLVFEDTQLGLQGAKAAGMKVLQVKHGKLISQDFL